MAGGVLSAADAIDVSRLPPPANVEIVFNRDIRPILETSCFSCHGPQKPKGKLRLDSHESALKGGANGVDIIPGESAKSPLIHFVAGLVEDSEMPPAGKGDPLTEEQISLLRAWIDQGVAWGEPMLTNEFSFFVAPAIGATFVDGDERKFREHHWQREGLNGGGEFELWQRSGPDTKIALSGYARLDDYRVVLSVDKSDVGFIHTGWDQYRKYYDDTGGYHPTTSTPRAISLDRDLFVDIGKAWIDFGLTLPDWPRMVLGYEFDYKHGNEASTGWGGAGAGLDVRNVAPVSKSIDETVHVIKFDLDAELRGVTVEERFRGEFYQLDTHYTNSAGRGPVSQDVREHNSYFQGANSIRLEKPIKEWWLASAGYFYSQMNADATFSDTVRFASFTRVATVPQITLDREAHVFNANSLFDATGGLLITMGVQSEWTREHGVGGGFLHRIPFTFSVPGNLATNPASLFADRDENILTEQLALRFVAIPATTIFAEGRLRQQDGGNTESDLQSSGGNFVENIDFHEELKDLRIGFNTSPWRNISLNSHYRYYGDESDYFNEAAPQPVGTYPGFVRARELATHEAEVRLVVRPFHWLKATLSYQYLNTASWTDTRPAFNSTTSEQYSPGGNILAGQSESHVYSAGVTLTPTRRLFVYALFSYQQSATHSAENGSASVVPYRGDIYSLFLNGTYVLSESTDLFAGYNFSQADFAQHNFAGGLPVGIRYQLHEVQLGMRQRLGKNTTAQLVGAYYKYDEPSSGGANDYTACSIFGAITFKLR